MKRPCVLFILVLTLGLGVSFGEQSSDSNPQDGSSRGYRRRPDSLGPCRRLQPPQRNGPYRLCRVSGTLRRSGCSRGIRKAAGSHGRLQRSGAHRRDCPPPGRARPAGRRFGRRRAPSGGVSLRYRRSRRIGRRQFQRQARQCTHSRPAAFLRPHGGHLSGLRTGRHPSRAGPQRGDQRLPGLPQ